MKPVRVLSGFEYSEGNFGTLKEPKGVAHLDSQQINPPAGCDGWYVHHLLSVNQFLEHMAMRLMKLTPDLLT